MKVQYVLRGNLMLLRGATTGLRALERSFKTEAEAKKEWAKITGYIKHQSRNFKKAYVTLSPAENRHFHNSDTLCYCYWDVTGIFKITEEKIA